MAYQAIYRRWRPQIFDDVIGQSHITTTLKNEIINGKTAHAYLFCGTRGTGKTTTAKILAKAVNCENPENGNPCGKCTTCLGIADESILDVVELDAASRTGVDDIRSVIEEAMFSPTAAKKKVYIIDEVHMISTSAFNALLKTLEEPPDHVMFILATTELHKIPATILSRCQRFDFRRIKNSDIVGRIKTIIDGDGYSADDDALNLVAELGDGSMRDALSVLDQCFSFKEQGLTKDDVLSIIGIADDTAVSAVCEAVISGDTSSALQNIDDVVNSGKDLGVFFSRLVKMLRDIMIVKLTKSAEGILTYSEEKMNALKEYGEKFTVEKLTNSLRLLNESYQKAKSSSFSRTIYELCIIKMCEPALDDSLDSVLARIADVEKSIKEGNFVVKSEITEKKPQSQASDKAEDALPWEDSAEKEDLKASEAFSAPTQKPVQKAEPEKAGISAGIDWQKVINTVRALGGAPIFPHLLKVVPQIRGDKLLLVFEDNAQMAKEIISKPRNLEIVGNAVREVLKADYTISCHFKKEVGQVSGTENDDPLKKLEEIGAGHSIFEVVD
ncbi:MAG: DNA polymerase III subunit gamma/tau [Clostridia bacterium]|nr:DNA polymerase III subunit gamma/tau [Clostridia bacterium]